MQAVTGSGRLIAGRYRLQGPIGRGAMGIVWRGRDELLARDVAVKEVQIAAQASPADAEAIYQRTLREARTAARLSHPSVVTVFDVVEENGSPWIVMELVNARSLDRVITEDGPLPPLQAAQLGASLVSALATAHSAGVLHRDVKPSNVLVTQDGKAVLTDFGIATFAEDPSQTLVGMVVGTPGFTAPERVRGDAATPASDLWSLGATLYAAVEGRGPFDRVGGSSVITAGVAREDAPRAPSAGPLGPVIDALLSRDPGTRPDATTASRLLAEASTAARTGARPLGDGWSGTEAGSADAGTTGTGAAGTGAADASAERGGAADSATGAGFLDPPVFENLSMPDPTGPTEVAAGSLTSLRPDDSPLVLPGAAVATAGLAGAGLTGAGLAGAEVADAASAGPEWAAAAGAGLGSGAAAAGAVITAAAGHSGPAGQDAPVLWQPLRAGSGGPAPDGAMPGAGGPGGQDGPGGGGSGGQGGSDGQAGGGDSGNNGGMRFFRRGGPARPSSGRWRLMVAGAGIAAIVIAAVAGWGIYTHTETTQALQNPVVPGVSAPGSSGAGKTAPDSGKSGSGGSAHGGPTAGSSGGTTGGHPTEAGKPSAGASATPGPGTSTSPGSSPSSSPSPSPSNSPTPTPSTSPAGTSPILPSGYAWHRFTAAAMGSNAGFMIALPSPWTQSRTGLIAHLNQPANGFHLNVNLASWNRANPLPEAQYLQGKDARSYNAYKELSLRAIGFKAFGGFRSAPAAMLKFSWRKKQVGNFTELVLLVTLTTKSGVQPYIFTLWAPSVTFPTASSVFHTAIGTFRPLPGA